MIRLFRLRSPAVFAASAFALCLLSSVPAVAQSVQINEGFLGMFKPALPERIDSPANPATPEKIDLGRMLYYDTRFSIGQDISCNTCHDLKNYGIETRDRKDVSLGHKDQPGTRNSPTVYNAASHVAQFWDGRANTIEEQATKPVTNPIEMAMPDNDYVVKVLRSIPGYVDAFATAFPGEDDPITMDNFGKAIGVFERGLTTPGPWDKFVNGDKSALTDEQKQGFQTFMATGCMTCHMGPYFGGNMFMKLGQIQPWPNQEDQGRFEVTGKEADRMMFKSPSLRNVSVTGPYFHDGSTEDLGEAVKLMAKHQLARNLSDAEAGSIVAFLQSLTGDIPMDYIKEPTLPPSGPDTPAPQK